MVSVEVEVEVEVKVEVEVVEEVVEVVAQVVVTVAVEMKSVAAVAAVMVEVEAVLLQNGRDLADVEAAPLLVLLPPP